MRCEFAIVRLPLRSGASEEELMKVERSDLRRLGSEDVGAVRRWSSLEEEERNEKSRRC